MAPKKKAVKAKRITKTTKKGAPRTGKAKAAKKRAPKKTAAKKIE